eukprot:662998-Hanusia_phi.AAC.1
MVTGAAPGGSSGTPGSGRPPGRGRAPGPAVTSHAPPGPVTGLGLQVSHSAARPRDIPTQFGHVPGGTPSLPGMIRLKAVQPGGTQAAAAAAALSPARRGPGRAGESQCQLGRGRRPGAHKLAPGCLTLTVRDVTVHRAIGRSVTVQRSRVTGRRRRESLSDPESRRGPAAAGPGRRGGPVTGDRRTSRTREAHCHG